MTTTANDLAVKVAEYKYYAVDILTNIVLTELPLTDVKFDRALKGAGGFNGNIAIVPDTKNLNLYDNTMPGKTAVFITRNGICVWGGIIWGRDYNVINRTLGISGSEFTSYLHHRVIWKTYNFALSANLYKTTANGHVKVEIQDRAITFPATDGNGSRTKVIINFTESSLVKYSGTYEILNDVGYTPGSGYFYIDINSLPARPDSYYSLVEVTGKVDTYQYVRDLITEAFSDFTDVTFANEEINPGKKTGTNVTYRSLTSNIASITTADKHNLVAGQRVEILNVGSSFNGFQVVTEVVDDYTFNFSKVASNVVKNSTALSSTYYPLKYREARVTADRSITNIKRISGVVTVTTAAPHLFQVNDILLMKVKKKYSQFNNSDTAVYVTSVPSATTFTYSLAGSNTGSSGINLTNSTCNFSTSKNVIRLTAYSGYGYSSSFSAGDTIYVSGVDDPSWETPMYNGYHQITEIGTDWFQYAPQYGMTREPGSVVQIAKRKYKKKGNLVTLTTSTAHKFLPGDKLSINTKAKGSEAPFDGSMTLVNTPANDNTLTYKAISSLAQDVKEQTCSGTITRTAAIIGSYDRTPSSISTVARVGSTATIVTSSAHNLNENDYVLVSCSNTSFNNSNVPVQVTDVISTTSFSYTSIGTTLSTTAATGTVAVIYAGFGEAKYPSSAVSSGTTRTITFSGSHGFSTGEYVTVYIKGYNSTFDNDNKPVQITKVSDSVFTYTLASSATATASSLTTESIVTAASYASKTPMIYTRSYGEFPNNANLGGIIFENTSYSQKAFINASIIGSEMQNIGEHLDKYSNTPDGFDYRIDCRLVESGGVTSFKKYFVLVPRTPLSLTAYLAASPLAAGEYAPPSAFGADNLTFEYPGNISDVTLQENAENAFTRIFVVGDSAGGGSSGGARFSGAADTNLLRRGWPLLDTGEKQTWPQIGYNQINVDHWGNYDAEEDFYKTATRFIAESKPPIGDYTIKINGSLDPVVGTYSPGDWCQVIINDDFIAERLNSYLEPRKTTILRKIESISVSVPNTPSFPEDITINLIPEWEVDKSG